ncbi:unnamed protein product [marine sediment metagenome]|uniref:DNA-binding protein n=1 Tax=marine sediment metagenome TaxID=412755 RepID=X1RHS5_9ZZZZ
MNKAELIGLIARDADLSKRAAGDALNSFIKNVSNALARKNRVTLVGFGTFEVRMRKARRGKNPRTGATLNIPAKNVAKFRAGAELKKKVR